MLWSSVLLAFELGFSLEVRFRTTFQIISRIQQPGELPWPTFPIPTATLRPISAIRVSLPISISVGSWAHSLSSTPTYTTVLALVAVLLHAILPTLPRLTGSLRVSRSIKLNNVVFSAFSRRLKLWLMIIWLQGSLRPFSRLMAFMQDLGNLFIPCYASRWIVQIVSNAFVSQVPYNTTTSSKRYSISSTCLPDIVQWRNYQWCRWDHHYDNAI